MAKKAKRSEENLSNQEPAQEGPKKPPILGTDHAVTLPTAQGTSLHLSYWDLWFALVAVMMHDGDLDRLAERIKEENSMILYDRDSIERKRRFRQAMRGYWDSFPVSPEPYAEKVGAHFRSKGLYHKDRSFSIARTLDRYVDKAKKLVEVGKAAQAQALLRGWMTVIIQLMEKATPEQRQGRREQRLPQQDENHPGPSTLPSPTPRRFSSCSPRLGSLTACSRSASRTPSAM